MRSGKASRNPTCRIPCWGTNSRKNLPKRVPIRDRRRAAMDPEEIADAYVREADALASGKRYEEAISVYDRAIGVYPDCSEAWTNKASVLRLLGKLQEALECAEKALDIGPSPIAEALCDNLIDELRRKGIIR